jgi:hypothetical protein
MKNVVCNLAPTHDGPFDSAESEGRQTWKFVVITTEEGAHLVTGPVSIYPYHAHLVDRFCQEREIASSWIKKPDVVEVLDLAVEIRGGGQILIDPAAKRMKIYGRSSAYGTYSKADLEQGLLADPFFHGFTLEIVGGES